MTSRGATLIAVAMLALAAPIRAQLMLYQVDGAQPGDGFGTSLAAIGDLDHDGTMDFAVGAPRHDFEGIDAGRVAVYSGTTGRMLLEILGNAHDKLGHSVAPAYDLNGEGEGDVIAGAPGAFTNDGRAYVFALPSGTLLASKFPLGDNELFGTQVAGLGEISGDGIPDYGVATAQTLVFGTPYPGCFETYSGAGGVISLPGSCGTSVHDAARDVNGDGRFDFLTSDSGLLASVPNTVQLRNGGTYAILDELTDDALHSGVRGFPSRDFDGDGRPDYLFTYSDPGVARVAQIRRIPAGGSPEVVSEIVVSSTQFGSIGNIERARCADVSGDGTLDVLLGFPFANTASGPDSGTLLAFDGLPPHELLFRIDGANAFAEFPTSLAVLGDLDGNGTEEFAVGVPYPPSAPGQVRVYTWPRWQTAWAEYGPPLVGLTVPHLSGQGLPAPRSGIVLVGDELFPAAPSLLVVGLGAQMLLFKGGFLLVTPDLLLGPFPTSLTGTLALPGALPAGVPPGLQLHFQLWIQDPNTPAGWAATNGLQATIQP